MIGMDRRQVVTLLAAVFPAGAVTATADLAHAAEVAPRTRPVLAATGPAHPVSERGFTIAVHLAAAAAATAAATRPRSVHLEAPATLTRGGSVATWAAVQRVVLDAHGRGAASARVWRTGRYRVTFAGDELLAPAVSPVLRITAAPSIDAVVAPAGAPGPRPAPVVGIAAVGTGANARVTAIPDAVWAAMQGLTWRPGAPVGRSGLRLVTVNHWGFDGYRYRGELVLNASTARAAAGAFTELYHLRFPVRRMVRPDAFGLGPALGADDYASMAADNTSGFNYRYVDGRERQRVLSPHAYGNAIDINTWENPYEGPSGVLPDHFYLHRLGGARGLFLPGSAATRALTRRGFAWGASYGDFQHFQFPFRAATGVVVPLAE